MARHRDSAFGEIHSVKGLRPMSRPFSMIGPEAHPDLENVLATTFLESGEWRDVRLEVVTRSSLRVETPNLVVAVEQGFAARRGVPERVDLVFGTAERSGHE